MSKEKLEKLEREKYVVERKLTAAMHKEKRLQSELKRLTRSGRTHRLCTRAGMLETFLKEPTTLTDDDVMELLTFIFHSEAIELEKEIEIEKEREGETGHPAPAAYGRYNNVILTDTELSGLKTELPDKWEYYIDRLSCHIASTGKQYHSHAATIYKWAQEDAAKGKAAPKQGIPDYSCKEGESL